MKTKQNEALLDIIHLVIDSMLIENILDRKELSYIRFNKQTSRYENGQIHLSLLTSGKGNFKGTEIIKNDLNLQFEPVIAESIELSTRFKYD